MLKKIVCLLFGHDDPVMDLLSGTSADYHDRALYEKYKKEGSVAGRVCRRCGKPIRN